MALQTNLKIDDTGLVVANAYAKITSVSASISAGALNHPDANLEKTDVLRISVSWFADAASRGENKSPIKSEVFEAVGISAAYIYASISSEIVKNAYAHLKTLSQFSSAEDV